MKSDIEYRYAQHGHNTHTGEKGQCADTPQTFGPDPTNKPEAAEIRDDPAHILPPAHFRPTAIAPDSRYRIDRQQAKERAEDEIQGMQPDQNTIQLETTKARGANTGAHHSRKDRSPSGSARRSCSNAMGPIT